MLEPQLLSKLELILAALNAVGHHASTLFAMNGYPTPYYNASIKELGVEPPPVGRGCRYLHR